MPLSRELGALTLLDRSGPAWPVGDDFTFTIIDVTEHEIAYWSSQVIVMHYEGENEATLVNDNLRKWDRGMKRNYLLSLP